MLISVEFATSKSTEIPVPDQYIYPLYMFCSYTVSDLHRFFRGDVFYSYVSTFLLQAIMTWGLDKGYVFTFHLYPLDDTKTHYNRVCLYSSWSGESKFCIDNIHSGDTKIRSKEALTWDEVSPYVDRLVQSMYTLLVFLYNKLSTSQNLFSTKSLNDTLDYLKNVIDLFSENLSPNIDPDLYMYLDKLYELTKVRLYAVDENDVSELMKVEAYQRHCSVTMQVDNMKVEYKCRDITVETRSPYSNFVLISVNARIIRYKDGYALEVMPTISMQPDLNPYIEPEHIVHVLERWLDIALKGIDTLIASKKPRALTTKLLNVWRRILTKLGKPFKEVE